jgi:hypothetical protein
MYSISTALSVFWVAPLDIVVAAGQQRPVLPGGAILLEVDHRLDGVPHLCGVVEGDAPDQHVGHHAHLIPVDLAPPAVAVAVPHLRARLTAR